MIWLDRLLPTASFIAGLGIGTAYGWIQTDLWPKVKRRAAHKKVKG